MTIDIDVSSPLGQVRAIIGDVTEPYEISDNVIETLLEANEGNVYKTSIQCLNMLVAYYAKKVNQEVGDARIWYGDRFKQYKQLLNDLQKNPALMKSVPLPILGGTTNSEMQRVKDSCETPYIGISVGEFSNVPSPERTGLFTVR